MEAGRAVVRGQGPTLALAPAEAARLDVLDHARTQANEALAQGEERRRQMTAIYAPLEVQVRRLEGKEAALTPQELKYLQQWEHAQETLAALAATVRTARERARAATYEYQAYGYWLGEAARLTQQLRDEYVGTGPQYEILIRRLVQAEIRARQLETGGTQDAIKEHGQTVGHVLKLVQALQRYQEGLGTDAVRKEVRDGIMAALRTLEPELQPHAPQAWRNGIAKLRAQIMGETASDPAASA